VTSQTESLNAVHQLVISFTAALNFKIGLHEVAPVFKHYATKAYRRRGGKALG
jgi:hypothetical protein